MVSNEQTFHEFNGERTCHWLQTWWNFSDECEFLFSESIVVLPKVVDSFMDLAAHECTIGDSCLVRGAPELDQVVVVINFLVIVDVFIAKLMAGYLLKTSIYSCVRVGLASTSLSDRQ
jgi:hypothetical protein